MNYQLDPFIFLLVSTLTPFILYSNFTPNKVVFTLTPFIR